MSGTSDARWRCEKRRAVQLRELRSAGSIGSSVATDPQDSRRGAGGAVAGVREAVCRAGTGSIAPDKLLRALLLQAFYSVRSEQQLVGQLNYNLLFRWFVGLSLDDEVWDETVFTKNRERLMEGDIAAQFLAAVLNQGSVKALLNDHFSVDGTLIEAWASTKSFRPKDGSGEPPGAPQPPTSLRRSAVTRSAPPASPPTSPTAARSSTPRKCGAREPAHDQALRPHEGAAHARRGGEDQAVSTENRAQLGR
jgi:transposase